MLRSVSLAAMAAVFLCGCATFDPHGPPGAKIAQGPTCAEASYHATLADGAAARGIAEAALLNQIKDLRGDMLTAGLRRLRTEHQATRCEAIGAFGGAIYCQATASVCGL